MLAILGGFAVIFLALALGAVGFYLWLEPKLGISDRGGTSTLLAIVLLAIAFRRTPGTPARAEDALRAAADPVQASNPSRGLLTKR